MQPSAKYIIHADVRASGVVERSDVVGAIFGQTEGLLGDDMDLRELQDASKVGRIDVDIESEGGRSYGTVKIASGLDRVETAVLAASLETLERVGPCRATCSIAKIEDARAAKRREIVDRATELVAEFDDEILTSDRLVAEVRERVEESNVTTVRGVPAGPRVEDSDAIIVVEGRADVRTLLSYGIKNVIAVEGTDIPDGVARLTEERTTTALLDGDRGGELILRELAQVGDVDYVAFAPSGTSVEDLDRSAVVAALRKKIPYDEINETRAPRDAFPPADGGSVAEDIQPTDAIDVAASTDQGGDAAELAPNPRVKPGPDTIPTQERDVGPDADATTVADHVQAVIESDTENARFLDEEDTIILECPAEEAFEELEESDEVPHRIVVDATVDQNLLDVAAQRGVGEIVAAGTSEFVKQPTSVRVLDAADLDLR